ncbi:50S ribosomal protein 6, chloroplastic-like [Salvia splendens]|uniref:50S ribosomal protein 6, chloroplastic-like n=1 Tax=Salvia splendens TaxID=180675 RepID=UPI001C256BCF|nr:50S ribosomal protein 6, chloroplastic-like [Salvia splendens]
MSVSAIFGTRLALPPPSAAATKAFPPPPSRLSVGGGGLAIECSSRPQKKATKHHMKTRPRKSRPSDIRHGPAVYPPLPPLPSEWTLVSDDSAAAPMPSQPAVNSE